MKNRFDEFLKLHYADEPLLIGNVWNVQSAKVFEDKKFKAVATSSAAVAETLGYNDGEEMRFEEYAFVVERVAARTKVPLSVDLESGYADSPEHIADNIERLSKLGVAGINIEDSVVVDGKRNIVDAGRFANKLNHIMAILKQKNVGVFVNVRTDCFLLGLPNALDEATKRTNLFQNTGVHGLFFPCITDINDIQKVVAQSKLPVNVMCMPGLPSFKELERAGVKRISMGNFLNKNIYQALSSSIDKIITQGDFSGIF